MTLTDHPENESLKNQKIIMKLIMNYYLEIMKLQMKILKTCTHIKSPSSLD